jgi:hypothetical protein
METSHCSLKYHEYSIANLEIFATGVKLKIYATGSPYASPPLTETEITDLIENYHHSYEDYKNKGKLFKAEFRTNKALLIAGLDTTADYIDALPGLTVDLIEGAGYIATKTNDSEVEVPAQTSAPKLSRGAAGEAFAEVDTVPHAESYGCFAFASQAMPASFTFINGQIVIRPDNSPTPPGPMPGPLDVVFVHDVSKSRRKHFQGLKPGVTYYFYFYAVNAAGVSILSAMRSIMVTD